MSKLVSAVLPEMADDLEKWHLFSQPLEGRVHSMYLDVKGLVTCGVGNLIDPVPAALRLPWKHESTGELASSKAVRAAWQDLKDNREALKKLHWKYAAQRNDLRLTDEDIDDLVKRKLFEFEQYMESHHFPDWREFPADAQLAICSMAWACGPGFPATFKNFTRFANAQDWSNAALCAKIRETGNPGVVPRNIENRKCFANAAIVVANEMDRDVLHWPGEAIPNSPKPSEPPGPSVDMKQPEIDPIPWITGLSEEILEGLEEARKNDNLQLSEES